MITGNYLLEWAIRSSALIGTGALLLWLLRVRDPSIRLAACIAAACGSLSMPLLTMAFPKLPVIVMRAPSIPPWNPTAPSDIVALPEGPAPEPQRPATPRGKDSGDAPPPLSYWRMAAGSLYALVAGLLLLRLGLGLLLARNLRRHSRATQLSAEGAEVLESSSVTSPVTVGLARPAILLPADWRSWSPSKLGAVLAHEQSHVRRGDPAVQFLSALHRAFLWHSPLSWVLHRHIIRLAEDVSDDAAVAISRDRTSYAEMLLEFMESGVRVNWHGAAMARYGSADARIHRILNSSILSTGLTRRAAAAICLLAVPLAYVAAAANAAVAPVPAATFAPAGSSTAARTEHTDSPQAPDASFNGAAAQAPGTIRRYLIVLGDTQSGSWDSSDSARPDTFRARFGNRFAWFRRGAAEHVITDESVLQYIERAMEPQKKVNEQQDQVNRLQSAVNELQAKVNAHQGDVNRAQDKVNAQQATVNDAQSAVNKRQDLLNRIHDAEAGDSNEAVVRKVEALLKELRAASNVASQDEMNRRQSKVNEEQRLVNEMQNRINGEQSGVNVEQQKVNAEQAKVNVEQTRVSAEFIRRIHEIFESAIRRGLAKQTK